MKKIISQEIVLFNCFVKSACSFINSNIGFEIKTSILLNLCINHYVKNTQTSFFDCCKSQFEQWTVTVSYFDTMIHFIFIICTCICFKYFSSLFQLQFLF